MSNVATQQSPTQVFQQMVQWIQGYQQMAANPQMADQAQSYLQQIYAAMQQLSQSDPNMVGALLGQGATLPASLSQFQQAMPTVQTNLTQFIASNPTWNQPTFTLPTTAGTSAPAPASGQIDTSLLGTGTNWLGLSPTNPIIPVGGTGTTQQGGTLTNIGGTLIDQNGNVPGQAPNITGITAAVDAWANSVGLGALSGWINSQIATLAGQGMGESDIATVISSTINKAPGFDALMPGYNQRIANGFTNTDANTGAGIAGYLAYRQQLQAMAETAGMVPGTLSNELIGNAWANDASTTEMSERITTEYTNAVNSLPAVQAELQNYGYTAGLSPGQLASYYLNPANTVTQLQQQYNSAVVGGEGVLTGFGEIGKSQAYALGAFLSNQGQNTLGAPQAANFFAGPLGAGMASIGAMAQTGFEQAQLGTAPNGPGVVNQAQLIGAGEGNTPDLLAVQRAAQTRAAPSLGGGGFAADQAGAVGAGFGSQ